MPDLNWAMPMALPIGQLIYQTASGIADAQLALDQASLSASQMMAGKVMDEQGNLLDTKVPMVLGFEQGQRKMEQASLYELGFIPAFYQFVDSELEIKVSMRLRQSVESIAHVEATPVDAAYINRYNFNTLGASTLKVRLAPVPPPTKVLDPEVLASLS